MRYRKFTPNKHAGPCTLCGHTVPEGQGYLVRPNGKWGVRHHARELVSPTGPWDKWEAFERGGCPK